MDQWQSLSFRVLNRLHRIDIEIHSDQSALQDSEECPAEKASHQLTLGFFCFLVVQEYISWWVVDITGGGNPQRHEIQDAIGILLHWGSRLRWILFMRPCGFPRHNGFWNEFYMRTFPCQHLGAPPFGGGFQLYTSAWLYDSWKERFGMTYELTEFLADGWPWCIPEAKVCNLKSLNGSSPCFSTFSVLFNLGSFPATLDA